METDAAYDPGGVLQEREWFEAMIQAGKPKLEGERVPVPEHSAMAR
jgi:hypothetical protein